MKRIFLLLSLAFSSAAFPQDPGYYYYDQLVPLSMHSQKLTVKLIEGCSDAMKQSLLEEFGLAEVHPAFKGFMIVQANAERSAAEMTQFVSNINNNAQVHYAQPIYLAGQVNEAAPLNTIVFKLNVGHDISEVAQFLQGVNYVSIYTDELLSGIHLIELNKNSPEPLQFSRTLFQSGLVEFSEPNFLSINAITSGDPFYQHQWGLESTGQTEINRRSNGILVPNNITCGINADIDADLAWTVTAGRQEIRIAVVDEGVDLTHPDLAANVDPGHDVTSNNGTNGAPVGDDAHGTAVAGIIAAVKDNGIGIAGVCPNCRIVPVKAFVGAVTSGTDAAAGVEWAAGISNGNADVINCSFKLNAQQAVMTTIINSVTVGGRGGLGCVVVCSTGNNDNNSVGFPASLPNVIAVGAMSPCFERKTGGAFQSSSCDQENGWGSNFGPELDVMAPGVCIVTTDIAGSSGMNNQSSDGFKMFNDDYVKNFNGTSAAAPFVSGVAGLVLSVNRCLSFSDVIRILKLSCSKVGAYCYVPFASSPHGTWNLEMGHGLVNAKRAVDLAVTNQNLSLSFSGGTDMGPSGSYQMVLYSGCSNIAAGTYIVQRHEIKRSITYPTVPNPVIIGHTNGLSAANPNTGNNELIISNVTPTSCDLSTFYYQVFNSIGQPIGILPAGNPPTTYNVVIYSQLNPAEELQNQILNTTVNYQAKVNLKVGRNVTNAVPIGDYQLNTGSNIDMKAGTSITWFDGTIINSGANLHAYIAPYFQCAQFPNGRVADYAPYEYYPDPAEAKLKDPNSAIDLLEVYPNPVSNKINIQYDKKLFNHVDLEIYDAMGRKVLNDENVTQLDVSKFDAGFYTLNFRSGEFEKSFKIVIQH